MAHADALVLRGAIGKSGALPSSHQPGLAALVEGIELALA